MSECDKSALELAESSEWSALHRLVSAHPVRAEELDDFGMMPLHWACTDTNVPLRAVKVLLDAYPLAAVLKNKGGLVPLHIAVKANAKTDVLRALVAVRDDALCLETPAGETPADLARACRLALDKVTLLTNAEELLRESGRAPPRASDRYKSLLQPLEPHHHHHHLLDAENVPPSNGGLGSRRGSSASLASDSSWVLTGTNSNSLSSTGGGGMSSVGMLRSTSALLTTAVPLPPRWRLDSRCNICQVKFTYFKNRHHCRSCGESVCSTHSNRRMALKHIGLSSPQRVCILCYDEMREHGKPASAVVNMYATRKEPLTAKTPSGSKRAKDAFDATAAPRHGPLLRPTRSVLALTASASGAASLDPTLTPVTYTSDSDDDNGSESDGNTRPRAWTEMDASENLLSLQHHARELQQSKRALEQQIARSTQAIALAQHEKLAHERTVADLRAGRMLDISRVPPDASDADDATLLEAEQDAAVDAALTCNHLGMALFEKGEFASAILELRRSVALNARDPDVWYNLARALHGAGELYEAEAAVQRALDLAGRSYALLALLGKILHAQGDDDKSIDVFREALGLMDHGDGGDSDSDDHDVGSATVGW